MDFIERHQPRTYVKSIDYMNHFTYPWPILSSFMNDIDILMLLLILYKNTKRKIFYQRNFNWYKRISTWNYGKKQKSIFDLEYNRGETISLEKYIIKVVKPIIWWIIILFYWILDVKDVIINFRNYKIGEKGMTKIRPPNKQWAMGGGKGNNHSSEDPSDTTRLTKPSSLGPT